MKYLSFPQHRNPAMVSITNQYIFTKPYLTEDSTNRNHPLLNEEAQLLRDNRAICQRVEDLRKLFLEYHQCLCHGDLHTGSVMINDSDAKVCKNEFCNNSFGKIHLLVVVLNNYSIFAFSWHYTTATYSCNIHRGRK